MVSMISLVKSSPTIPGRSIHSPTALPRELKVRDFTGAIITVRKCRYEPIIVKGTEIHWQLRGRPRTTFITEISTTNNVARLSRNYFEYATVSCVSIVKLFLLLSVDDIQP